VAQHRQSGGDHLGCFDDLRLSERTAGASYRCREQSSSIACLPHGRGRVLC
jgi:hypothetical protein